VNESRLRQVAEAVTAPVNGPPFDDAAPKGELILANEGTGMGFWNRWLSPSRRLNASSTATLASSIRQLRPEDRGWITLEEASKLFSRADPQYAFGQMDDEGKRNLETFATEVTRVFEFWPSENRLYFVARQ
jgi:hypothetical protein